MCSSDLEIVPPAWYVYVLGSEALSPPGSPTLTSTMPAACAGVVTVACVGETTTTFVPGDPPKDAVKPPAKPVPVSVTDPPPLVDPLDGVTVVSVIAGAALYTKPFGSVVEDPPAITVTATGPADRAGATTVIFESLIRLSEVPDTPPNCTLDAALSPMPFTVTTVPPLTAPDVGDIDVMLSGLEVAPYV